MVNLKGKHPKIKRKLKNPEEKERELLQFYKTPQNNNQTKPSAGNHNKCIYDVYMIKS